MTGSSKFGSLRVIATIFRSVGILLGIIVGVSTVGVFVHKPFLEPQGLALEPEVSPAYIFISLCSALLGLLFSLSVYAIGEAITCFVDIEKNTRRTMEAIEAESE